MTPQTPVVNASIKYVNGLAISKTDNKIISMEVGSARDSTNTNDILLNDPISLNGAIVGANGVDVAALVASQLYAVYAIGDSTEYKSTAGLLSLNTSAPNLPGNYDMYRRVGWVRTDDSANILQFWQYGQGQERMYYYDVGISALSGGSATSFTPINLATSIPPIETEILFNIVFTPSAANHVAEFLPFFSLASNGIVRFGITSGVVGVQVGMITVPCKLDLGIPKVLYKVASSDVLTLFTNGFKDFMS